MAHDGDDEDILVESAARGDTAAFEKLFHLHYGMIYSFSFRLCLSAPDAQDIAQETFIRATRSLPSFRRESSFKNWLYRIAANASQDWRRRNEKQTRLSHELASAAQETVRPDDNSRVTEALAALPEDLRVAIVLVFYEDLNHAQAARIIGCAESTVSWRVFMAKRRLKKILSAHG